jgi:hypothetical protein
VAFVLPPLYGSALQLARNPGHFRILSLGTAGKVPEGNIVNAIHGEVDKKHAHAARKLQEIYGSSQSEFSNGIKLRLIPCLNSPDLNKNTR